MRSERPALEAADSLYLPKFYLGRLNALVSVEVEPPLAKLAVCPLA